MGGDVIVEVPRICKLGLIMHKHLDWSNHCKSLSIPPSYKSFKNKFTWKLESKDIEVLQRTVTFLIVILQMFVQRSVLDI